MNKKFLEDMQKMMIQVFNDGYEQLIMPRFEEMEERFDKQDKSLKKVKQELKQEFKAGQQSLSSRLEVVERKVDKIDKKLDQVIINDKDQNHRIKEVERIVKAN